MLKQKQPFFENFHKTYVTRDLGRIRTRDIKLTGQGPNQHTKSLAILFSNLITVFESYTQKHVIFDFGLSHSAM